MLNTRNKSKISKSPIFTQMLTFCVFLSLTITNAFAGDNIIVSIISSPVVGNGLVGDAASDFNILFHSSNKKVDDSQLLDPANPGQFIPVGGYLELELGGSYKRNPDYLDANTSSNKIAPNRNIVLTTAPQSPIVSTAGNGVQHGNWSVSDNGARIITITPNGSNSNNVTGLENARAANGFKAVHLRPDPRDSRTDFTRAPFINGPAGTQGTIYVRIFAADGMVDKYGFIEVEFTKPNGPQISLSNVGLTTSRQGNGATVSTEIDESVHFQHVAANTELRNTIKSTPFSSGAPYALRFLLFADSGSQPNSFIPQMGLKNVGYYLESKDAKLVQDSNGNGIADKDDIEIGEIKISGPGGNATILANPNLTTSGNGSSGPNGSLLIVPVKVGSAAGRYEISLSMKDGNEIKTYVIVVK